MKRRELTPQEYCIRHGVFCYPVYFRSKWYIEVKANGTTKRYKKPIGSTSRLNGKTLQGPIQKTYEYWADKLKKAKENESI